jgi:hypothetical protein
MMTSTARPSRRSTPRNCRYAQHGRRSELADPVAIVPRREALINNLLGWTHPFRRWRAPVLLLALHLVSFISHPQRRPDGALGEHPQRQRSSRRWSEAPQQAAQGHLSPERVAAISQGSARVNILYFDTETTGLPRPSQPLNHPSQPHITQLGFILEVNGTMRLSSIR